MTATIRNTIALILILASLACLYPGLTLPMMNINIGATVPLLGKIDLFDQTQSIMQSVRSLQESGNLLVAGLIFLFSVIIPIFKAVLLLVVLGFKNVKGRMAIYKFVAVIGKWSMADVFVVGIFMAFLAGKANPNATATLFEGFHYFVAYCLISIAAIQVMDIKKTDIKKIE